VTLVNYGVIDRSIEYYKGRGFQRIEAPWLVTDGILDITKPADVARYVVQKEGGNVLGDGKRKSFVGSAEQSFVYLMTKGYLPTGLVQAVTPCIRNEPFDETHVKYFVKNELIFTGEELRTPHMQQVYVNRFVDWAHGFFVSQLKPNAHQHVKVVRTEIGQDIMYRDVEVGSYGARESAMFRWVYGTGVAEPRFSRIADRYGELI
jgi:hypothetical protein